MSLHATQGSHPAYAVVKPCQTDVFSMDMLDPHLPMSTFNYTKTLGDYASCKQRAHTHRERSEANKEALRGLACQEWRLNNGRTTFHETLSPSALPLSNDRGTEAKAPGEAVSYCYQPGDLFGKRYVCGRCTGFYWDDWRTGQIRAHCGPDFSLGRPPPTTGFQKCH